MPSAERSVYSSHFRLGKTSEMNSFNQAPKFMSHFTIKLRPTGEVACSGSPRCNCCLHTSLFSSTQQPQHVVLQGLVTKWLLSKNTQMPPLFLETPREPVGISLSLILILSWLNFTEFITLHFGARHTRVHYHSILAVWSLVRQIMSSHLTFFILQMRIIVHEPTKCFPHFLVDNKALPNFLWKSSKSILKVSSYFLEVGETDLNSLQPFSFHPLGSSLLLCSFGYGQMLREVTWPQICAWWVQETLPQEPRNFSGLWDTEGIWNDILSGNSPRTLFNLGKVARVRPQTKASFLQCQGPQKNRQIL